jgi:S1-C subfamily serine protease
MSSILEELANAVQAVAGNVGPAVVHVGRSWHGGSGVVIADGRVLTNAHNIHDDTVAVSFADGRSAEGSVLGVDVDGDLAVIGVDTSGLTAIPWAADAAVMAGAPVFAVAAAESGPRITFGLVSGVARAFRGPRGRRISGSIEHTAPMAPGSSGSALVDGSGRLVGLNTNRVGGGFYLAIPVDAALHDRLEALARGEAPRRPRLGVGLAPAGAARKMRRAVGLPERDGLLVRDVEDDGAAARAGITTGDLIVAADGKALSSSDDLADVLAGAGASLELTLLRGVDERVVTVDLGAA